MPPLSDDQKRLYAGGLLIHHMLKDEKSYDVLLLGGDEKLQPILEWLHMKHLLEIDKTHHYTLTKQGKTAAENLEQHYKAMLTYFDLFAHVDLEAGEFAFSSFSEFSHPADWAAFLAEERWDDLRLAVLTHLGGAPMELVYLQFIQEGRFDITSAGWQIGLTYGALWEELIQICDSAISPNDLGYSNEQESVSSAEILNNIADQGFQLLRHLYPHDEEIHTNLQAWHPQHGVTNPALVDPKKGAQTPLWKRPWGIS